MSQFLGISMIVSKKTLELVDFVYYSMISPLLIMIVWVMSYEFLFMKSYTLELED